MVLPDRLPHLPLRLHAEGHRHTLVHLSRHGWSSRTAARLAGLALNGVGWMMFVYPPLGSSLFTFIAIAAGLAEIPLLLWLLIMGVNPQRWNEQAAAAGITSST